MVDEVEIYQPDKEFILCSAIRYNGIIVPARRHSDCYKLLTDLLGDNIKLPGREHQGFLTSHNRYVDRKEALVLAKKHNQIYHSMHDNDDEDNEDHNILISEDLY